MSLTSSLASRRQRPSLKARLVMAMLTRLSEGELRLIDPNGDTQTFGQPTRTEHEGPLQAEVRLHDYKALDWALMRGDIGFAEGYMEGLWTTPDLPMLLKLLVANRHAVEKAIHGSKWALWLDRIQHVFFRANTLRQAKKNIEAHYDLGNDFYKLWLDPTMTYSSALFNQTGAWGESVDLEKGQHAKTERAIRMLGPLADNSQTLEIGCGWGGMALARLKQPGRHLGITLSSEQKAWADASLAEEGLGARGEIRLQDYRATQGEFDGILSIEMIEAVGETYWPTYFDTLHRCLKPGARAVVQVIVIRDELFDHYRSSMDFIQKYIFPGGMLLSPRQIDVQASKARLHILDRFSFGQDYARTLRCWLERFDQNLDGIRKLGFDSRFIAMWRYYLAYCEAGFRVEDLDVLQVTFERSREAL